MNSITYPTKDKTLLEKDVRKIENICGVECFEKNGTAYLKLETVARGLGFTQIAKSGNEVVRWERVYKYLSELNFSIPTSGDEIFIPENIFYRLAMKAKNETAEKFQALVADEIIPSIRKNGGYIANQENLTPEQIVANALIVAQNIISQKEKQIAEMEPKAQYFDALVDRNLLTSFRETAKELGIKEGEFISWLIGKNYIYRDSKNKLQPYSTSMGKGLFEIKEYSSRYSNHAGTQTLITPKGRETFRLLLNV